MTDNVENLILEHLKRFQTEQAATRADVAEILSRMGQLESMMARLLRESADSYGDRMQDRHAFDALRTRIERIERRLELEP